MTQFIEFLGNHPVMSTAWVVLFILLVSTYVSAAMSNIKMVNTHQMTMMVNRENATVVDIRKKADFDKGHITESLNIPLEKITKEQFGALEKKKSNPIVVVCNAGISAKTAAKVLNKSGFDNVAVLTGGFQAWTTANLPVIKSK